MSPWGSDQHLPGSEAPHPMLRAPPASTLPVRTGRRFELSGARAVLESPVYQWVASTSGPAAGSGNGSGLGGSCGSGVAGGGIASSNSNSVFPGGGISFGSATNLAACDSPGKVGTERVDNSVVIEPLMLAASRPPPPSPLPSAVNAPWGHATMSPMVRGILNNSNNNYTTTGSPTTLPGSTSASASASAVAPSSPSPLSSIA
eukprot:CAMPEP_0206591718 /NCGR_PEP_ID=MMETSP0325_2-20121206/40450_1 /ASSEMBLY_ACC=CAM_ASM_000347 /TAXON_ID=2866 /ORGANISM="Crypthecodinium cohnii, Strain Seligo" /LENGTH=202 /DNA_ID=CAMNT_0054101051 /DNA_START=74 /DNA_END=678 /DNA_ORIENTATION=-